MLIPNFVKNLRYGTSVSIALLTGCTFVQVTPEGADVIQASTADMAHCKDIGEVVSTTRSRVLVARGDTKVRQELIDLARNQAAGIGANAIVPVGEPEAGMQKFRAYKCD